MKLSNNLKKIILVLGIFIGLILISWGICLLFDKGFNGMIIEWFNRNYIHTVDYYAPITNEYSSVSFIDWEGLKRLFFVALVCILCIGCFIVMLSAYLYAKSRVKLNTKIISNMLNDYIASDKDITEIFSEDYEDIAIQMSKIKNQMKSTEQRIKDETVRKNDLILYLAHDLKMPLASVIGYLHLLKEEPQISEELKNKYISISLDKAIRLEDLTNEFFEIARFNLSDITLRYSTINLTRLLEQLIFEFKPMLQEKNLLCNLNADNEILLQCDADKLQRVFDNLLRNAVAYSFPDTQINIEQEKQSDYVVIRFTNHGNTIASKDLERIFEQFYRLDVSRNTNDGKAGLGLAIAKEIITLHGGTITAGSENEMIEFTVTIPLI